ncbi:MAG TPA: hypothetical protein VFF78_00130 [Anaerolineaceae bacterium]|nr:hypothetical protein [Anaerolineaceae bacterium]
MKQAISVSIGSSKRDKTVEIELLGQQVKIERRGTDGDMQAATRLYEELDGKVDAFGVGGTDLGLMVDGHWYRLHSVSSLVSQVKKTPVVDGTGLKHTLERGAAELVNRELSQYLPNKRVLAVTAVDRWGLSEAFFKSGYEVVYGDMMFSLGLPIALHSPSNVKLMAKLLIPIVGRLPFHWVYPTGKEQEKRTPKWGKWFQWATIIAGDCHYIRRYMPDELTGKIIVTNTTTPEDKEAFHKAGVKYLITTTPVLDGRSFGTNMMEAALVAASGRTQPIDYTHPGSYFQDIEALVRKLHLVPQLQELG